MKIILFFLTPRKRDLIHREIKLTFMQKDNYLFLIILMHYFNSY